MLEMTLLSSVCFCLDDRVEAKVFRLVTRKNIKARETPDFTDLLLDTGLVASYNVTINQEKRQEARR